eukprot:295374-Hanusia_phi.AAC.1
MSSRGSPVHGNDGQIHPTRDEEDIALHHPRIAAPDPSLQESCMTTQADSLLAAQPSMSPWTTDDSVPLEDAIESIFRQPSHSKPRKVRGSRRCPLPAQQLSSTTRSHLDSHPSPAPAFRAIASDPAPSVANARTTTAQTDQAVPLQGNVQPAVLSPAASCTSSGDDSSSTTGPRVWTEDEHQRFLVALRDYCPDAETRMTEDGRVR